MSEDNKKGTETPSHYMPKNIDETSDLKTEHDSTEDIVLMWHTLFHSVFTSNCFIII